MSNTIIVNSKELFNKIENLQTFAPNTLQLKAFLCLDGRMEEVNSIDIENNQSDTLMEVFRHINEQPIRLSFQGNNIILDGICI